mgnify:CR=1 FL=1|jgi:hypothetical protein
MNSVFSQTPQIAFNYTNPSAQLFHPQINVVQQAHAIPNVVYSYPVRSPPVINNQHQVFYTIAKQEDRSLSPQARVVNNPTITFNNQAVVKQTNIPGA